MQTNIYQERLPTIFSKQTHVDPKGKVKHSQSVAKRFPPLGWTKTQMIEDKIFSHDFLIS